MTTPTNEFPLESPSVVPGSQLVVSFIDDAYHNQKLVCIAQLAEHQREHVFLSEVNVKEILTIADGRLFNRMEIQPDALGVAVDDQTMAFLRDHERLLTEYVLSPGQLEASERLLITLIQACVLTTIKLIRSQQ